MNSILKILFAATSIFCISQCREPFQPDFETGVDDHLVVEGFIHVGEKAVTRIKLSRISPLENTNDQMFVETSAEVRIESEAGEKFILIESKPGIYDSDSLILDPNGSYRVAIKRASGLEYASAFTTAVPTPSIDSIYWQVDQSGIHVVVSTHDDDHNTKFYSWSYMETWEIESDYTSYFKYVNGKMKPRSHDEAESMQHCWKYADQEDLAFASTENLSEDIMHYKLLTLPHLAERLQVKYSIVAQQRSLSEDEYRFLRLIQKNSTSTGSLFDAMPGEIHGNIVSTTSEAIPAFGYVGSYLTETKRIFIYPSDINTLPTEKCTKIKVSSEDRNEYFGLLGYTPSQYIGMDASKDSIYDGAATYCMDCRLRGDPKRPDYW